MKSMKRLMSLLMVGSFLALGLYSCDKEPDSDKLDYNYIVKTNHSDKVNYGELKTYYMGDKVYLISGKEEKEWIYGTDEEATAILDAIDTNMASRGYTKATTLSDDVDMTFAVVYFKDVSNLIYGNNWWNSWNGWYGGWYNGWGYYPYYNYYPVVYSYEVGSLEIDMIHHSAPAVPNKEDKDQKPVIWTSYATGLNSGSMKYDSKLVLGSINQSFIQSPYLKMSNGK